MVAAMVMLCGDGAWYVVLFGVGSWYVSYLPAEIASSWNLKAGVYQVAITNQHV